MNENIYNDAELLKYGLRKTNSFKSCRLCLKSAVNLLA